MKAELSSDLRDCFALAPLAIVVDALFPLTPACEFAASPMHGCECNGCLEWRAGVLA